MDSIRIAYFILKLSLDEGTSCDEGLGSPSSYDGRQPVAFDLVDREEMKPHLHVVVTQTRRQSEALPLDVQKVIVGEEEQQMWSSILDHRPFHVKEEQEELWTGQEELRRLWEADGKRFPFSSVPWCCCSLCANKTPSGDDPGSCMWKLEEPESVCPEPLRGCR